MLKLESRQMVIVGVLQLRNDTHSNKEDSILRGCVFYTDAQTPETVANVNKWRNLFYTDSVQTNSGAVLGWKPPSTDFWLPLCGLNCHFTLIMKGLNSCFLTHTGWVTTEQHGNVKCSRSNFFVPLAAVWIYDKKKKVLTEQSDEGKNRLRIQMKIVSSSCFPRKRRGAFESSPSGRKSFTSAWKLRLYHSRLRRCFRMLSGQFVQLYNLHLVGQTLVPKRHWQWAGQH